MITDEVYVEIELLRKHGMSLRKIAEEVGCAVNTVRSHLAAETWPHYQRNTQRVTKLSAFVDYLCERQTAAHPAWIPATVLLREINALGYLGSHSQLRAYMHCLKPTLPVGPVVRFETAPGEQTQVDWVEFRHGHNPLYAFCATLGYSRVSFVEFVTDMKVETQIACHQHAFDAFGGVTLRILYDNMKTVVIERDAMGDGAHRFHAGFLDYARHCGFVIKLCRPYRAKTKGKVERFNGYLRRSFYVPLVAVLPALMLRAIALADSPASYFNRDTSRILRMDSRSTKTSLLRKRGHDEQNYPTSLLPQGWPHGRGISGRMRPEYADTYKMLGGGAYLLSIRRKERLSRPSNEAAPEIDPA